MSDTTVTTEAPTQPTPLPNDSAARSATGEILEPSQIAKPPEAKPTADTPAPDTTSTQKDPKAPEAKDAPKPDAGKVPDTYADFKAPDGYTIDPKTIEAAAPIFKELGLTQDQAQRLVDFHTQQMIAAAKAPADAYETTRADWQAKVAADAELKSAVNGDAVGLAAVKLDIGRALNAIGDASLVADFKDAMNLTGAGDNPAFIKTLWKLSSFITEGKHVAGAQPSPHGQRAPGTTERPSAAQALYPKLS